jgi:hypothetical protein
LYQKPDAPRYILGHAVTLAMVAMGVVIYSLMSIYFYRRNKNRQAGKDNDILIGKTETEISELGDEHPAYVFTY